MRNKRVRPLQYNLLEGAHAQRGTREASPEHGLSDAKGFLSGGDLVNVDVSGGTLCCYSQWETLEVLAGLTLPPPSTTGLVGVSS